MLAIFISYSHVDVTVTTRTPTSHRTPSNFSTHLVQECDYSLLSCLLCACVCVSVKMCFSGRKKISRKPYKRREREIKRTKERLKRKVKVRHERWREQKNQGQCERRRNRILKLEQHTYKYSSHHYGIPLGTASLIELFRSAEPPRQHVL